MCKYSGSFVALVIFISACPLASSSFGQVRWNNNTGTPDPWLDDDGNWAGGSRPGSTDIASFALAGIYDVWWNANTVSRLPEVQSVRVDAGEVTFLNRDASPQNRLTILGPGNNTGTFGDFSVTGSGTILNISGLLMHSLGGGSVGTGATMNIDGSHTAGSRFTQEGWVGFDVAGDLNISSGGVATVHQGYIGRLSTFNSHATVTGTDSRWNIDHDLFVGWDGTGRLDVSNRGVVAGKVGSIAQNEDSLGVAVVDGAGSRWDNNSWLRVGNQGSGHLWIHNGGVVTSASGTIGRTVDGSGMVWVRDAGSHWNNSAEVIVGNAGDGNSIDGDLLVSSGGRVTSTAGYIGLNPGAIGNARIRNGAEWNMSGNLHVGEAGDGRLTVSENGVVSADMAYVGKQDTGDGTLKVSEGSTLNLAFDLYAGHDGVGEFEILSGIANSRDGFVANSVGSSGQAIIGGFVGESADWNISRNLFVGGSAGSSGGDGSLWIGVDGSVGVGATSRIWSTGTLTLAGGSLTTHTFDNSDGGNFDFQDGTLTINGGVFDPGTAGFSVDGVGGGTPLLVFQNGASDTLTSTLLIGVGKQGSMQIGTGSTVTSSHARIGLNPGSSGLVTVQDAGSYWSTGGTLSVGHSGFGLLNIESGGVVSADSQDIGVGVTLGSTGVANISGINSELTNGNIIRVGFGGDATLNVDDGGFVGGQYGIIGSAAPSHGLAKITGSGSHWASTNSLSVGWAGNGSLEVYDGGLVSSESGQIGVVQGSIGNVNIGDPGSQWQISGDLMVGGGTSGAGGQGTLDIGTGGLVTVGGVTTLYSSGAVNLDGGRFEFGETSLAEFEAINAMSGSMAGDLFHGAYTDASTLTQLQNHAVDISDVRLSNSGVIYGNASLNCGIANLAAGELEVVGGERLRFGGTGNTNAGEINNYGGVIRFNQDLTNMSGGFVSGRGQFIADGGWTNEGVMAFSGGWSDVLGDVNNLAGGQIVTSGGAVTTFYDDVVHNGTEIRTAANSASVFFGEVSGAGPFTGIGTVYFEGDLRPGNSPDILSFEGDVVFGGNAASFFELGGQNAGEFDQLLIGGDLAMNGSLAVELIDGFRLTYNDEFLIADVSGQLTGEFAGLADGALVGNYDGMDLFVTYAGGDGNDVLLFTAVPEPSSPVIALGISLAFMTIRRRYC